MSEHKGVTGELARELGLFHIIMMGLGMMIGAGVFVGIGLSIHGVGPGGLLLTFGLNGLVAICTAMSFAELSSAIPRAGGAYNFSRIAFGRGASFIGGWVEWFASSLAGAFYAMVFGLFTVEYVVQVAGWQPAAASQAIAVKLVAFAAVSIFIYINYRGSSETGKIGAIFTVGQMIFVISIAVAGIIVAIMNPERIDNFKPFMPYGWWKLFGAMGVIYVAFEGFEVIAQAGDETIDPKRNVPKAMLYSVAIVTVTYLGVAFATVVSTGAGEDILGGMAPWQWLGHFQEDGSEGMAFKEAAIRLMPQGIGALLVTLAVIFSSTSALNATIYSATRASYALGRDGMLPKSFAKISKKRHTPHIALAATAVIILIAAILLNHEDGAATASIMFLFLFFLVNLCVIKIRRNMGDELEYGFMMPLFPLLPIFAIICQAAMAGGIMFESYVAWIIGPVWVISGVIIYHLYSKHHAEFGEHEIYVFADKPNENGELSQKVDQKYKIMVSVANPDNALSMVQTTYKICEAKDAQVELLHMVPVPEQVPLSDADKYMLDGKEGIMETMLYLAPLFPLTSHLRYCRNIARGIVSTVKEKRADMLILGWHGKGKSGLFNIGSTIDPVVERSPCDVVVLKDCGGNQKFKRILLPIAGGPNGAMALEIASILADDKEGQITGLLINRAKVKKSAKSFDIDSFLSDQSQNLSIGSDRIKSKTITSDDIVRTILEESEDYDLVVLGCTRDAAMRRITHTPVPETIARLCKKPVVMVKSSGGLRSFIKRWV